MASLNRAQIIGRLGQDPQIRYTQQGTPVASLRVATDESYKDGHGEIVKRTEWHTVVVWNRQAESCSNYLRKGSQVYAEGKLQTRKWQSPDGTDRYTTEINAERVVFLSHSKQHAEG